MSFNLLFTGDTFLDSNRFYGEARPFSQSIIDLFAQSNYICVNLETTIGTGGSKVEKAYNFQVHPDSLKYLTENRIEICSLANNHSLDYGQEGLENTKKHLHEKGIDYIGTEECNQKDVCVNRYNVRICSYYGNQKGLSRIIKQDIVKDILRYKKEVDTVIVCLHWGEEYVAYPSPNQKKLAHALIDAGASVIIGHHPHVMQGYEEYNGGMIFYSLGNFNFFVNHPYAKKLVETTKAYCVGLNISEKGKIEHEIVPIHINEKWQPEVIVDDEEKKRFLRYYNAISKPLEKSISKVFYLIEASPHYFHNHLPSWEKRIHNYGNSQRLQMIKWLIHPAMYRYYIGMVLSLFHKSVRY